ncbi:MAG: 7,8-didemethyl-8-hydroxy-5-deazariboflavin synthase [Betaproteobacteria bacterium RIFCSPLOWO2_12_FULL_62_13b]|nr:MAG: 7,8-didemethyl-8-hydroxy-5-deazariboflavin synthase [Betaproteobacteria bacterium RIFCSPLOWO2_12_FULL_62_13b]
MGLDHELYSLLQKQPLERLMTEAAWLRDQGHGPVMSFSRKVFVPLTRLCKDVCHYCGFAAAPRQVARPFLTLDEVREIAKAGERAGCQEALFTLGDKPEDRYAVAREQLKSLGCASTVEYLEKACDVVLRETSLLPHINAGVLSQEQMTKLRKVSVSQGIMLESAAERLCRQGAVHYGSPDKHPAVRLDMIRGAGKLRVPLTSGILIGIGETRDERIDALIALRDLHVQYGHVQEIIVQNFRAKPDTPMARAAEPDLEDLRWTIAAARLIFGPEMNIQAPPNLTPQLYPLLIEAGINDWGGLSPVTPDHVNPEAPWPHMETVRRHVESAGKVLVERLAVYPQYARSASRWADARMVTRVLCAMDSSGFARADRWSPGLDVEAPKCRSTRPRRRPSAAIAHSIARARAGEKLNEDQLRALFEARDRDFEAVCAAADEIRRATSGDVVRYVVNRNLNYTNICSYRCKFCAFCKATRSDNLRGPSYDLEPREIARRVSEAWARGATEVCMQGGIHPDYTGETYLSLLGAVKDAVPEMHVHAFSPLEVWHGAATLGLPAIAFLKRLQAAGLGSLPGTAAEVLDDRVRTIICPDKLKSAEWLEVISAAHEVGLRTTATIMFGHVETPLHWARHLLAIRELQTRTGGFTEFVPLPFVHMEAPMYFKGLSRKGPTYREAVLMHAVARLALHPVLPNIQVSWVKMGAEGIRACLQAGANDLGGTLMNESISHAAGAAHAQELPPAQMDELIKSSGRTPQQRTTLYGKVSEKQTAVSYSAAPLAPIVLTPPRRRPRAVPGTAVSCLEAFV